MPTTVGALRKSSLANPASKQRMSIVKVVSPQEQEQAAARAAGSTKRRRGSRPTSPDAVTTSTNQRRESLGGAGGADDIFTTPVGEENLAGVGSGLSVAFQEQQADRFFNQQEEESGENPDSYEVPEEAYFVQNIRRRWGLPSSLTSTAAETEGGATDNHQSQLKELDPEARKIILGQLDAYSAFSSCRDPKTEKVTIDSIKTMCELFHLHLPGLERLEQVLLEKLQQETLMSASGIDGTVEGPHHHHHHLLNEQQQQGGLMRRSMVGGGNNRFSASHSSTQIQGQNAMYRLKQQVGQTEINFEDFEQFFRNRAFRVPQGASPEGMMRSPSPGGGGGALPLPPGGKPMYHSPALEMDQQQQFQTYGSGGYEGGGGKAGGGSELLSFIDSSPQSHAAASPGRSSSRLTTTGGGNRATDGRTFEMIDLLHADDAEMARAVTPGAPPQSLHNPSGLLYLPIQNGGTAKISATAAAGGGTSGGSTTEDSTGNTKQRSNSLSFNSKRPKEHHQQQLYQLSKDAGFHDDTSFLELLSRVPPVEGPQEALLLHCPGEEYLLQEIGTYQELSNTEGSGGEGFSSELMANRLLLARSSAEGGDAVGGGGGGVRFNLKANTSTNAAEGVDGVNGGQVDLAGMSTRTGGVGVVDSSAGGGGTFGNSSIFGVSSRRPNSSSIMHDGGNRKKKIVPRYMRDRDPSAKRLGSSMFMMNGYEQQGGGPGPSSASSFASPSAGQDFVKKYEVIKRYEERDRQRLESGHQHLGLNTAQRNDFSLPPTKASKKSSTIRQRLTQLDKSYDTPLLRRSNSMSSVASSSRLSAPSKAIVASRQQQQQSIAGASMMMMTREQLSQNQPQGGGDPFGAVEVDSHDSSSPLPGARGGARRASSVTPLNIRPAPGLIRGGTTMNSTRSSSTGLSARDNIMTGKGGSRGRGDSRSGAGGGNTGDDENVFSRLAQDHSADPSVTVLHLRSYLKQLEKSQ